MTKAKESVLFALQVVGAIVTLFGIIGGGLWWFASFYFESSFNDNIINSVVTKHESELKEIVKENNDDHKKIFSTLQEIKYELRSINSVLKKDIAIKKAEQKELTFLD